MKTKLALSILLLTLLFCFEKGMAQAPAWLWAKAAGGNGNDYGNGICTDASGNVVVTGGFSSDSITFGTTTLTKAQSNQPEFFVVKYDASGNVMWAKSAGGIKSDVGSSISTDVSGNVLVTGVFSSDSITFGTTTLTNTGIIGFDIFIVKFDASGNVLWAKSADGPHSGQVSGITTDASGNILLTGFLLVLPSLLEQRL